jgi:hypothetical protein
MNKEQAIKIIEAYVSGDISENELYIKEAIECVKGLQEPNATTSGVILIKRGRTTSRKCTIIQNEIIEEIRVNTNHKYKVVVHNGEIEDLKIIMP